jgi:hypothetical protein
VLLRVGVGGKFTDAVVAVDGRIVTTRAPSTPHDQSEGVRAAVQAALERAGRAPSEVRSFSHGMTVATNALLEGRGDGADRDRGVPRRRPARPREPRAAYRLCQAIEQAVAELGASALGDERRRAPGRV